jgi:hypothetical protein
MFVKMNHNKCQKPLLQQSIPTAGTTTTIMSGHIYHLYSRCLTNIIQYLPKIHKMQLTGMITPADDEQKNT